MTAISSSSWSPWRRHVDLLAALALTLSALAMLSPARAHDYTKGSIHLDHPWTRATPGGARAAGGYVRIENRGTTPDVLVGGDSTFSKTVEIHEMIDEGGVMKMRALGDGLTIPPGGSVELKPGSYHVMFMGLQKPLVEGENVKGALVFRNAGRIEVEYKVEPRGAAAGAHGGGSHSGAGSGSGAGSSSGSGTLKK